MMWRAILVLLLPCISYAQIEITEIMYDPKGADAGSGGEWIEVYNSGATAIDLTSWIFFEADTNHGITADSGVTLPASSYAVISRDLTAFKNFFTSFSGPLFKASFSLNEGESLAMKSAKEATPADSISYSSDLGAKDDGNSLQKINGSFVVSLPTPGAVNKHVPVTNPSNPSLDNTQTGQVEVSGSNSSFPVESKIKTSISGPANGLSGVEIYFKAETSGLTGTPLPGARHLWAFGDGSFAEGNNVVHTYSFPGSYTVVLEASSEEYAASSRHRILVSEPKVRLKNVVSGKEGFVEIENRAPFEVDLSYWQIRSGGFYFILPKNTFISPMTSAKFPNSVTNLELIPSDTHLLYPSGFVAVKYETSVPVAEPTVPEEPEVEIAVVSTQKRVPDIVVESVRALPKTAESEEVVFFSATSSLALAEVSLGTKRGGDNWIWFGMMFAIIVISSVGYLFLAKKNNHRELYGKSEVLVDGQKYSIIEDKNG